MTGHVVAGREATGAHASHPTLFGAFAVKRCHVALRGIPKVEPVPMERVDVMGAPRRDAGGGDVHALLRPRAGVIRRLPREVEVGAAVIGDGELQLGVFTFQFPRVHTGQEGDVLVRFQLGLGQVGRQVPRRRQRAGHLDRVLRPDQRQQAQPLGLVRQE